MTEEYFNQVIDLANLIRNIQEMKALIEEVVLSTIKHSSRKQSKLFIHNQKSQLKTPEVVHLILQNVGTLNPKYLKQPIRQKHNLMKLYRKKTFKVILKKEFLMKRSSNITTNPHKTLMILTAQVQQSGSD
jgi:hypothetical protein